MKTAIGLDIGHSTVKLSFSVNGEVKNIIFPSVAIPAFTISDEGERARAAKETVDVDGQAFFFGDTALFQSGGVAPSGLVDNWVEKPEHTALLLGAFKKINEFGVNLNECVISLGLPTNLNGAYKEKLKALVAKYVQPDTLFVMPQAITPFHIATYDSNGFPLKSALGGTVLAEEAWGVVEVGYYTTDFMLIDKGRWFQGSEGVCKGVYLAATRLMNTLKTELGEEYTLASCEQALRTKKVKRYRDMIDVSSYVKDSVSEIVRVVEDESSRLMKDRAREIDGVLVAGGGASLVYEQLLAKWPHAVLVDNARFAVAEGMRRFGEADLRRRGFPVISN